MFFHLTIWIVVAIWGFIGLIHYCVHEHEHDYHIHHRIQKFVWTLIHGPLTWFAMAIIWIVLAIACGLSLIEKTNTFLKFKAWLNKP